MRVVSLVTDPDNLWDYNTGIYVMGPNAWAEAPYGANNQGANFWMDWEKPGNVEIFTAEGETLISQGCGVKLQGQYSRQQEQKGALQGCFLHGIPLDVQMKDQRPRL